MAQTAHLRLERKEAEGVLRHFLNSANNFNSSPNYDPGLERAESRFQQWSSDAEEALVRCFTTRDIAERFNRVPVPPSLEDETPEQARYRVLMNAHNHRREYLKRLKGTLAIYEVVAIVDRDGVILGEADRGDPVDTPSRRGDGFFQFGVFRLDGDERVLLRDGRLVPLPGKVLSTLLLLVRNNGHVVEKDALMQEVWPDEDVEEANLAQHIFTLRRALGESTESPKYIETVPRRGVEAIVLSPK